MNRHITTSLSLSRHKLPIYALSFLLFGCLLLQSVLAQDTLNVFFATNSSAIDEDQQSRLKKWLEVMNRQAEDSFAIYGYTDDRGSVEYNQKLALDRAIAVRYMLVEQGIVDSTITRVEGEGVALASNETENDRSKNRRVSVLHFTYEMKMAIREQQSRGVDAEQGVDSLEVIDLTATAAEDKEEDAYDCQQESRVLKSASGVEVVMGPCCLEKMDEELHLNVVPVFSRQQMLIEDVATMDIDGDCLETDGIVMLQVLNAEGKAVKLQDSCMMLRIPTDKQDERKRIYFAVFGKDSSGFAWQTTFTTPEFDKESDEKGYYEVPLNMSRGVAIQKMVPDSRKHRHDPKIWIDVKPYTKENCRVHLSSKDVVLSGVWREKNACYFRRGCIPESEAYVTVFAKDKDGNTLVAHKALKKVKYRGSKEKGKYSLKKEDFFKVTSERAMKKLIKF